MRLMCGGQRRYCLWLSHRCAWIACHTARGATTHSADFELRLASLVMVVRNCLVCKDSKPLQSCQLPAPTMIAYLSSHPARHDGILPRTGTSAPAGLQTSSWKEAARGAPELVRHAFEARVGQMRVNHHLWHRVKLCL